MLASNRIRIVEGPRTGATFPVCGRVTFGRAPGSTVEIIDHAVSRLHAEIIEEDGEHVLVDLESLNGTRVGGEAIRRITLRPGTSFTIVRNTFVYEQAAMVACGPSNARPRPHAAGVFSQTLPHGLSLADRAPLEVPSSGRRLIGTFADGSAYEGNLLADILEYRASYAQIHTNRATAADRDRFVALDRRLRGSMDDEEAALRPSSRFSCALRGHLRLGDSERPCTVVEIGVDGAKLELASSGLTRGAEVELALETDDGLQGRDPRLSARITSTSSTTVELSFSLDRTAVSRRRARQVTRPEGMTWTTGADAPHPLDAAWSRRSSDR